jgi:predicted DNA-binding transcriptional regulator AlpA
VTLEEYLGDLARRREDAARVQATAPVAEVLAAVLEDLRGLVDGAAERNGRSPEEVTDRLLTATEVAERLHTSRRYVYEHAAEFPFTRRLGTRPVRFSERGLVRWLARR